MKKLILLLITTCALSSFTAPSIISEDTDVKHTFQTNEKEVIIHQITDEYGTPQYYYTDINEYPAKGDKHAKTIELRMYWDVRGNYLTYELRNGKEISKNNGKSFSDKEYTKLHHILNNPYSEFGRHNYDELNTKQCENQYQVDAVSGATSTDYPSEYINGAIKTTYILWHIAHGDISTEIKTLNDKYCSQQTLNANMSMQSYEGASSVAKFIFLNSLHSSEKTLSDNDAKLLLNALNTGSYAIFSTIISILEANRFIREMANDIIPFLSDTQFKQVNSYNVLENNKQHRLIKQTALDFQNITF